MAGASLQGAAACTQACLQSAQRAAEPGTLLQDVYAMGIILWELLTLEMPWAGQTNPFQVGSGAQPRQQ